MTRIKYNPLKLVFFVFILGLASCSEDNLPSGSSTPPDPGDLPQQEIPTEPWRIPAPSLHFEAQLDLYSGENTLRLSDQEQIGQISRLAFADYLQFGSDSESVQGVRLQVLSQCLSLRGSNRYEQRFDLSMAFSPRVYIYQILPTSALHVNTLSQSPIHCGFQFVAVNETGSKHHFILQTLPIELADTHRDAHVKLGRTPLHFQPLAKRVVTEDRISEVFVDTLHPEVQALELQCEIFSSEPVQQVGPFFSRPLSEFHLYTQGVKFQPPWKDPFIERPHQKCRVFAFGDDRLLGFSEVFELRFKASPLRLETRQLPIPPVAPQYNEWTNSRPYFAHRIQNPSPGPIAVSFPKRVSQLLNVSYYSIQGSSRLKRSAVMDAEVQVHGLKRGQLREFPQGQRVVLNPGGEFELRYVGNLPFRHCPFEHPQTSNRVTTSLQNRKGGVQVSVQASRLPQIQHVSTDWTPNGGLGFDRLSLPNFQYVYDFSYDQRRQPITSPANLSSATEVTNIRCR